MAMFMSFIILKGFVIMYFIYDVCKMLIEVFGEFECLYLRWVMIVVIVVFGYIMYVVSLVFTRFVEFYIFVYAVMRKEEV